MYQDACDGRLSRSEVNEELHRFKRYFEEGEEDMKAIRNSRHEDNEENLKQYFVHLIETLKRLVSLCKR
jgi:ribose 1,5-bisphosphokinase PhnN